MKKIDIREIEGFTVGNFTDEKKGTGCTVILCEKGAVAGCDIRGGGPATRETDLLRPENMVQEINGVCLSGGSAFGLEACDGVMAYCREKGIGFDTGFGKIPIICGASLFDLVTGDPEAYATKEMGYKACEGDFSSGNYGAGTGATVGKLMGVNRLMKGGLGSFAVEAQGLKIGAVSAVNALGDIFDTETAKQIAGLLSEDGNSLISTEETMFEAVNTKRDVFNGNTTISCIITNAKLTKANCTKIAAIAHDGYARAIKPVHSSADGDSIFIMSTNEIEADFDTVGALAAYVVSEAICDGVKKAESAYGLKCAGDFLW